MATTILSTPGSEYVSLHDVGLVNPDQDPFVQTAAEQPQEKLLDSQSDIQVLIVGAGIHGILTAYHLITDAGISANNLVVVDKAGGWGGTWYWNRYPGVMCDIEGYSYLPLLEETGHIPRQRYPPGYEIREHCERIAAKWNLKADFGTTVTGLRWEDHERRWKVSMTHGSTNTDKPRSFIMRAQFVVGSSGIFPAPHVPHLPGFEVFRDAKGKSVMHTARWDWELSGGSQRKPDMVNFQNKRVGIIGTGATAVQVIPHVASWAKELLVFQRSPAYVGKHYQEDTTPELWKKVAYKKGWQQERMINLDSWFAQQPDRVDRVQDGWTQIPGLRALLGSINGTVNTGEEESHTRQLIAMDYSWCEQMRERITKEVVNPKVAEKLKPWAPSFCKRPTFHNSYLATFNKPNVTLVATDGCGVTACTAKGVIANNKEHELDIIIFATGYVNAIFDSSPSKALNAPIIGKHERSLGEKWEGDDFGTIFGMATNGFPNLFFFTPSGSGLSSNVTASLYTNARTIAHVIGRSLEMASDPGLVVIEASKSAENEYTAVVAEKARWFSALGSCTPGIAPNSDGTGVTIPAQSEAELKKSPYGGGLLGFRDLLAKWVQNEDIRGFNVVG